MMGGFSSLGFLIGNYLTGLYMRQVAFSSLYGAAGAILVFLLWAFYSALTIFLVLEGFTFFRNQKMRGGDPSFF
jgi:membrane protein